MKKFNNFIIIIFSICLISTLFTNSHLSSQEKDEPAVKENISDTPKENTEADKPKDEKAVRLNTIVITATRSKEKLRDVPVNVDVITSKDIEATGATTLGDVIGQKINGHYQRYSSSSQSTGIIGNLTTDSMGDDTKNRIIILVDGHRLGTGNLGKIPPEIIDRVEVIKGPGSALYGSTAMGGVINIITKKGKGDIQNTTKLETGSFEYLRSALTSGGYINDFSSYFMTANYMQVGDYQTKNYGTAYNSSAHQAHAWGNLCFYPAENQSLRIGFSYADIISHYPQWASYNEHTYYSDTTKEYNDLCRGHGDLEYNLGILNNKINWKASAFYIWDKRSWFDSSTGKVEDNATIYNDYTIGTDRQFETLLIPLNKTLFGYTFDSLKRESKIKTAGVDVASSTPDFNYYNNAVYFQDTLSVYNNCLIIVLGARYDRFDVVMDPGLNSKDQTSDNFSPRGGIVFKISDLFRIRGNVGKAFRAPSADELAMYYNMYGYIYEGNPDLKPETSTTYEAGFDISPNNISLGATYSIIKMKDMIDEVYLGIAPGGEFWYKYNNIEKAKLEVIDCYFNMDVGSLFKLPVRLNLSTNFTYNKKYKDEILNKDLSFIADRQVKSSITTGYKATTVSLSHVYNGHVINFYGEQNPSFYFFNLTVKYELSSNIAADTGIFNLTNEDYEWVNGFPMPERNYKIGLAGKF